MALTILYLDTRLPAGIVTRDARVYDDYINVSRRVLPTEGNLSLNLHTCIRVFSASLRIFSTAVWVARRSARLGVARLLLGSVD